MPPLTLRHPLRSLLLLFSHRAWLVGFATGIGGWVLYVVALVLAPLSLVQASAAGGIGLLALLVHRRSGPGLGQREWRAVGVSIVGLCLLGISLAGGAVAGRVTSAGGGRLDPGLLRRRQRSRQARPRAARGGAGLGDRGGCPLRSG